MKGSMSIIYVFSAVTLLFAQVQPAVAATWVDSLSGKNLVIETET